MGTAKSHPFWSLVYPHDRFKKAGYEVVVAILGGVPASSIRLA